MNPTNHSTPAISTGLVLSGGGAKGAYQVGVLKALLELGASIDMVAGASMGALNGAVLACAPSLPEGVQRLEKLWQTLAERSPLEANWPAYLKLLASLGLTLNRPLAGVLGSAPTLLNMLARSMEGMPLATLTVKAVAMLNSILDTSLMGDETLRALMDEYLDFQGLQRGLPLYVSVYESLGGLNDALRCVAAETGLVDTPPSRFVHVQALPEQECKNVLMGSAAIPMLFQARQIGNAQFTDGGQGGWQKVQGNTPITPLIEAGCKQVIVTHLSDGSLWSRHDFPDTTVLEIRPQSSLVPGGSLLDGAKAALGFDARSIERLMEQGYNDTLHCVGRVMKATQARQALQQSEHALQASLEHNHSADANLAQAMARL
ncbi:phospholipase [Vandammella animalimorsus]|uniref:Phospholipase n=1 Tax=Vandammella animalimorsus TaxID=2029117 RepID=A0A2A2API0_9BURK|nr:patatin-like phospholipase family protein [Vandammella animalimorsus]PAT39622.1 phospholipase [Vandammella animalimorsus]